MAGLGDPPILDVLQNAGFEQPLSDEGQIPGWAVSTESGVSVSIDATCGHGGSQSVKLMSSGPVATLISRPFAPPKTGRLTMLLWLRGNAATPPPLRIALVGRYQGRDFSRFVHLAHPPGDHQQPVGLTPDWKPFPPVLVNDLPLDGLSQLQVRFDLLGPGEVWIDDVELCDLVFTYQERVGLFKMIAPAQVKLSEGKVSQCLDLLESYWPRFLLTHVDPQHRTTAGDSEAARAARQTPPETERTANLMDRLKGMLPKPLRF
jgi:hypothetical protein